MTYGGLRRGYLFLKTERSHARPLEQLAGL